jgi:ABC-type Fe3+ transport system permease subunit
MAQAVEVRASRCLNSKSAAYDRACVPGCRLVRWSLCVPEDVPPWVVYVGINSILFQHICDLLCLLLYSHW